MPKLLATPPEDDLLIYCRNRAQEKKAVGPRAAGYLKRLGCPVHLERLNPYAAFQWVKIMEELSPQLADATEHWAAKEESEGRVPATSPDHATAAQIQVLRSPGHAVPEKVTHMEVQRLIAGPPTAGQLRRLKFYGITLPHGACKDEAAKLIDQQMRENWASEEAYQASRRKAAINETGESRSSARLQLRQSPAATPAEFVLAVPIPPSRSHVWLYVIVLGLGAFAIMGLVWSITKGGPSGDLLKQVRPVVIPQKKTTNPPPGLLVHLAS